MTRSGLFFQEIAVFVLQAQRQFFIACGDVADGAADGHALRLFGENAAERRIRFLLGKGADLLHRKIGSVQKAHHPFVPALFQKRVVIIAHASLCPPVRLAERGKQIGERLAFPSARCDVIHQLFGLFSRITVDFFRIRHIEKPSLIFTFRPFY